MAIISVSNRLRNRGYLSAQFQYAMTYVAITFIVLLILNLYTFNASQTLFYQSKETALIEKCQLASDEISTLEVLNPSTVSGIVTQLESLKATRLIVTDQAGSTLYDSADPRTGVRVLLPEVLQSLDGFDVFSGRYENGVMISRAATPVFYYGTIVGCVYMTEHDAAQGRLFQLLQTTILRITLILEAVVILFSLVYSRSFSYRMRKIMSSMRIIQNGDYTHKVAVGGNDELTVLGQEFNELTERLQTSEEKRRRFVSDASHELKTPLASIKLLSDSILQNDMDMETVREFVGDIGNEADRLNRMTAKLLSLTKVDATRPDEIEIINMEPTINRVCRMLTPVAEQASISIQEEIETDCPVLMLEDDLYQIVFNLIENGIKYNVPGGSLRVRLTRQEDNAVLTVQDTGMGIPEEALSHIFERFYRVDKARSRASGGSGLGLAIVSAIVRNNRGTIEVSSELGRGTCFTVTFPVFDTEAET